MSLKHTKHDDIFIEFLEGEYCTNPDFIFNRFDLLYGTNQYIHVICRNKEWFISYWVDGHIGYLGLYLVEIPKEVFYKLIHFVFKRNRSIRKIFLRKSRNNYCGQIIRQGNHYRIELPDSTDNLLRRMNKKGRYNYGREKRLLNNSGTVEYLHWNSDEIPTKIVETFFDFKYKTHGREYHMLPHEYLEKYAVTDVYAINVDNKTVAVLSSCEQCECVFLENLAYDTEYSNYSVGFQIYVYFLEEMIRKEKKQVYTGGGDYEYKKRFNAIEEVTYEGYIYRTMLGKVYGELKRRMKRV